MTTRPNETMQAVAHSLLGAALVGSAVAGLEAAWTRSAAAIDPDRAASTLPFVATWLGCLGVIAPVALFVALAVSVGWRVVSPGRPASVGAWSAALRAEAAGHRADLAAFAPLAVLGAFAWATSSAYLARAILRLAVPPMLAGLGVAAGSLGLGGAIATLVLAAVPPLRRHLAKASDGRPLLVDATATGAVGVILAATAFAVGVSTGSASGEGGALGIWGVFKREELDLRAAAEMSVLVLAALFAPVALRNVRVGVAILLGVAPLAATIHAATALERAPDLALAIDRGAPLSKLAAAALRRLADRDGDGAAGLFGGGDCNDRDPTIGPSESEILDDGIDQDCSGEDLTSSRLAELTPRPAPEAAIDTSKLRSDLNVVLITIDTLRSELGYAGYARPVSPNLDKLAKESTVYERAYSLASYTGKSVGPMLIGKYGSETDRNWGHFNKFGPRDLFVAERLQKAGVHTMSVQAHRYFDTWGGLERGFEVLDMAAAPPKDAPWDVDTKATSGELTDAALAVLAKPENTDKRFFLWVHYLDPHADYLKHEEFDFGGGARGAYDGEIAFTDKHVGRLLDAIAGAPWGERTAIIVTSDHGEAFGENGMHRHGFEVWESLVHVPLVVHVPGAKPKRIAARRSAIDVVPTIIDLMGAPRPTRPTPPGSDDFVSGSSLVPELLGDVPAADEDILVDMPAGPYNDARRAFIHGDLKLIVSNDAKYALYDLAADPGERTDLSKRDPDALKTMKDRYAAKKASLREIQVTGKKR